MAGTLSRLLGEFGDNLNEDVGVRSDALTPAETSPVDGRKRIRNAARIDIGRIVADAQHREHFDEESIERLSQSIAKDGQLQPIRVRWDEARSVYVVIAGERRFRACQRAGLSEIDCIVVEGELSESDIIRQQIIENCHREDLQPVERARAFRDLMEREGWDGRTLGRELNVSDATVSNALKLLDLGEDMQEKVDAGEVTAKVAVATMRKTRASTRKAKAKAPRPKTFRTRAGRVVVEPKVKRTYVEVLELALEAARQVHTEERKAA